MDVRRVVVGMLLGWAFVGQVLAKDEIQASAELNPPPVEALGQFDRYDLKPATLASDYAGHKANQEALASFQRNLDERVGAWVAERNAAPATHAPVRTLVIEPRIEKIRFISGGARFWAGAFAGSSRILVKVKLTDQATGALIAEPEFYQHAKGMAGAWTFGAADNSMLVRSASLALDYLKENQATAQGGRTGWEKE
ncbi:uncharacterized protein DUF4410 [Pseudoxanthomonas sp. 3HH-4]|uniref:DUF4410 domain-containing protein n=1 Tax=Pseudoxanthomonas sp. 3HH-4 TaxID=1690214 RepID=UPI00114FE176|nr:DUF4410 domain-containing protein [Pseudoxanthomonas sp. 3HH-4]TQM17796.1 uncharacterized protein DUF4410 [Pseudoxanthomonas sp. 3HH-4]